MFFILIDFKAINRLFNFEVKYFVKQQLKSSDKSIKTIVLIECHRQ